MKRLVDKKHLQLVASLPCAICKTTSQIQVHHLLKPYDGARGLSMRSGDNNVIPLCFRHHTELHTRYGNEAKFFISHGLEPMFGQNTAKLLYETKQMIDDVDDDLPF